MEPQSFPWHGLEQLRVPCLRPTRPLAPQYGIVLDAGSSHTAMFVYKWPADKENDTGVVSEHSMCDVQGKGCCALAHALWAQQCAGVNACAMPSCPTAHSAVQGGVTKGTALCPKLPTSPRHLPACMPGACLLASFHGA